MLIICIRNGCNKDIIQAVEKLNEVNVEDAGLFSYVKDALHKHNIEQKRIELCL